MRLMRATAWIRSTFEEGSRPTTKTVAKWVAGGNVPGTLIDGVAFIDADQFVQDLRAGPDALVPCVAPKSKENHKFGHLDLLS
jgi:hypothetical protein